MSNIASPILLLHQLTSSADLFQVFLESVLLEMRAGKWDRAVEEAQSALKIHTGTGRYDQLTKVLHLT